MILLVKPLYITNWEKASRDKEAFSQYLEGKNQKQMDYYGSSSGKTRWTGSRLIGTSNIRAYLEFTELFSSIQKIYSNLILTNTNETLMNCRSQKEMNKIHEGSTQINNLYFRKINSIYSCEIQGLAIDINHSISNYSSISSI